MKCFTAATIVTLAFVTAFPAPARSQIPEGVDSAGEGPLPISNKLPLLGVPVGTILPYIGPADALPAEWLPCDGRTVEDEHSPLHGVQLPDLTEERFLMGVNSDAAVGLTGGSNSIPGDGLHNHIGSISGRVQEQSGTPRYLKYSGDRSFQHSHQVDIRGNGAHSHGGDNRPHFYGVRFIVRVK